jgi:hypothetical protein
MILSLFRSVLPKHSPLTKLTLRELTSTCLFLGMTVYLICCIIFFLFYFLFPMEDATPALHNDDSVNRTRSGPQMLAGWLKQKMARERVSVGRSFLQY